MIFKVGDRIRDFPTKGWIGVSAPYSGVNVDFKEIERSWFEMLKQFGLSGEVWFCTMAFKFDVGKAKAEINIKEWLRRLGQVLHLKKDEVEVYAIFDLQVREVIHVHLLVKAKGLFKLNKDAWQDKWADVDSVNDTCRIFQVHNNPTFCSKPSNGSVIETAGAHHETAEGWLNRSMPKPLKKKDEEENEDEEDEYYSCDRVAAYLVARHSQEIITSLQIWGRGKRA